MNINSERLTALRRERDRVSAKLDAHLETIRPGDRIAPNLKAEVESLSGQYANINTEIAKLGQSETREADAGSIRAMYPGMFSDSGPATAAAFGDEIRNAINEVREGRAAAFVDYPETPIRAVLTEAGSAGDGVGVDIKTPVSTLRARSVVMGLPGILKDDMKADVVRYPRIGNATVEPTAEGAELTDADTDTDSVTVRARKYSTYEELTTELVEDYSADALAIFGDNMLKDLGLKVDLGLLEGNGALHVVGIRNAPGANSTSVAATPTNFVKFRDAEYELMADDGVPAVWVQHPRTWKTLGGIKTGLTSDETTLLEPNPQEGPKTLLGYPVAFSTQITLTEGAGAGSWAALLDTSQLVVLTRRAARLEFSRDYKFNEDKIAARATWRGGLAVLNPEAISLLTDIRA